LCPPIFLYTFWKQKRLNHRRAVDINLNVTPGFFSGSCSDNARVTAGIVRWIDVIDFQKPSLLNI
jgi:hypothetical protein